MKAFYFILILLFNLSHLNSQSDTQICDNVAANNYIKSLDNYSPDFAIDIEDKYENYLAKKSLNDSIIYTVPVVVHIVHFPGTTLGEEENLSDDQIQIGLSSLNEAFAGNGCTDDPEGSDMKIQFALATRDKDGQATDGILRHASDYSRLATGGWIDMIFDLASDQFPATEYINVYLINEFCYFTIGGECMGPEGLATGPVAYGNIYHDFVIVESSYWYRDQDLCQGTKLVAHEFGHYFNLLHTFENGCENDNCIKQGDRVCDTPPDNLDDRDDFRCINGTKNNSCNTDSDDGYCDNPIRMDQDDPEENYMDYSNFSCQFTFTEGQKKRMRCALTEVRIGLYKSYGLEDPCLENITFERADYISEFAFVDEPTFIKVPVKGADSIAWFYNEILISNSETLEYVFTEKGHHILTLVAYQGTCKLQKRYGVNVYKNDISLTGNITSVPVLCQSNGYYLFQCDRNGRWAYYLNGQKYISQTGEIQLGGFLPGTHLIYFEIIEDYNLNVISQEFEVQEAGIEISTEGTLLCEQKDTVEMIAYFPNLDYLSWRNNLNENGDFTNFGTNNTSQITTGGRYYFKAFNNGETCDFIYDVSTSNDLDFEVGPCEDCRTNTLNLCIKDVPDNHTIKWSTGYGGTQSAIRAPGYIITEIIDPDSGCSQKIYTQVTSIENPDPACSAGAVSRLRCGDSVRLLGTISNQGQGDIDFRWTTKDGNISGPKNLRQEIDRPGTYVLTVWNKLTDCSDSDTLVVLPYIADSYIEEEICEGDNYDGYTESGIYTDSLTYGCSCDSIRTLNLTVLPFDDPDCLTSKAEELTLAGISIYPNPTNSIVTIESTYSAHGLINIYNMNGQLVIKNSPFEKSITIDTHSYKAGTYIIEFIFEDRVILNKLIKI